MRFKIVFMICIFFLSFNTFASPEEAHELNVSKSSMNLTLDDIMDRVEKTYSQTGFSADFTQTSTLKALEITDTASGTILVKRPGMMRWEYNQPEKQLIITDGNMLWIYRPEDKQVITGNAPDFFKNGKGAGFLSDMKILKKKFSITLENMDGKDDYILKLFPNENMMDISYIYLSISKKTFLIQQIISYNSFEDETKIILHHVKFQNKIDNICKRNTDNITQIGLSSFFINEGLLGLV